MLTRLYIRFHSMMTTCCMKKERKKKHNSTGTSSDSVPLSIKRSMGDGW